MPGFRKEVRLGSRAGLGAWPRSVGQVPPIVVTNVCRQDPAPASLRAASPLPASHLSRGHCGLKYRGHPAGRGVGAGALVPRDLGLL